MTIQEAIEARHSVRAYKDQPLSKEVAKRLEEEIAVVNQKGNLHVQQVSRSAVRTLGSSKSASDAIPSWFRKGVEAALLAPTAVNQQKFSFEYVGMSNNRHQVRARRGFSMIGYTKMDLGIAKYHFEVGAGKVNFEWV